MDPDACYRRFGEALVDGDEDDAAEAHRDLMRWMRNGGFAPKWTQAEFEEFARWERADA